MKHLYKEGLRRCYNCMEVKPLTEDNFYKKIDPKGKGFSYECRVCARLLRNKYNENHRKDNTKSKRWKILQRDNFTCQYCGRKAPEVILEVDHKVSRQRGGTNDRENLITACRDCNKGKHIKHLQ